MSAQSILQHLDLDIDPAVEPLHYSYESEVPAAHPHQEHRGGPLHIPPGLSLSFDSYFNSFFENYWYANTAIDRVALELELQGRGVVSVQRQAAQGPFYLVERVPYDSDEPTTVRVELARDTGFTFGPGRVFFEVEPITETVVHDGRWVTPNPGRDVRASVVFCTFNREHYLGKVLQAIVDDERVHRSLARVFVVNQGSPFQLDDLVTDVPDDLRERITIIEQENLGGCGGFTRGLYETLVDDELTHFILLDDDIKLHAESLFRGVQFLRHAHPDRALGGHMLDLVHPNVLYEAGARLHHQTMEPIPIHHPTHLDEEDGLEVFLDMPPVDYNGWWFFGGSVEMLEEVGLPMPSFIRGDDMEFGVRIAGHGYQTVPMPGIGVWHEPFYLKLGNWQLYFEVRNRLTMLSLHGNGDLGVLKRHWRRVFTRDAMLARYHSCQFMIAGIRDYLDGPDSAFVTTNGPLLERLQEIRELGPTKVADSGEQTARKLSPMQKRAMKPLMPVMRAARVVTPLRDTNGVPTMVAEQLTPWRPAVFDRYRVIEPGTGHVMELHRQPELERRQLAEFEGLLRELTLHFGQEVVDRSAGPAWLGWWRRRFGADDGEPAAVGAGDSAHEGD